MLSVFIREPEFQGQTKDKLATLEASRIVENAMRDAFDHWLAASPSQATKLLDWTVDRAEERLRRRAEKEVARKTAMRKLRLPGKLADCTAAGAARLRDLHRRGRFGRRLGQAGARPADPGGAAAARQDPQRRQSRRATSWSPTSSSPTCVQALGCGTGSHYRDDDLRYEKVVIMTDADVDGAHIASLLITFFYRQMPELIDGGHLYLAVPPLYRLTHGGTTVYARDDAHKDELIRTVFKGKANVEIGRFKGLGEMMPAQLKETTMDPSKRTLLQVARRARGRAPTRPMRSSA